LHAKVEPIRQLSLGSSGCGHPKLSLLDFAAQHSRTAPLVAKIMDKDPLLIAAPEQCIDGAPGKAFSGNS